MNSNTRNKAIKPGNKSINCDSNCNEISNISFHPFYYVFKTDSTKAKQGVAT